MNATKYEGWVGKMNGRKVWVMNASADSKKLKIKVGVIVGYRGWSGGSYPEYSYAGSPTWVDADKVTR